MSAGWIIGVMVGVGEAQPARHFFAVGHADRAKAEWTAIDKAQLTGPIAESPVAGLEPVHVVAEVSPLTGKRLALRPEEVRSLGRAWPRRWIPA